MTAPQFDEKTRTELEAAAFRRLVQHLRERTDVQNIDMMNLAGFCRNCLSNWMKDAADARGQPYRRLPQRLASRDLLALAQARCLFRTRERLLPAKLLD